MNIIVVGCGRVGVKLCEEFNRDPSNRVTVVDVEPAAFNELGSDFAGGRVVGQGFDEDILLEAGIDECDAFAAVTSSDNVNLMASEVARRLYHVQHVITRMIDPSRIKVYGNLGLDYVCDTEIVGERIAAMVYSRKANHLDSLGDYEVLRFALNTGGELMRIRDLEALGDIQIDMFEHDGSVERAQPNIFLHDGDIVIASVRLDALFALSPYMKGQE